MDFYIVGGAVRDVLLGNDPKDLDYVIVGADKRDIQDMLDQGYSQVGCDFPVFLHPNTKDEYALARIERKTGKGYQGFSTDSSESVTLEDDLLRRDLTINAMAVHTDHWDEFVRTKDTKLVVDPHHGMADLCQQVLRHVSHAFADDPVRILRVARFAARYNFNVANETVGLMREIVNDGEANELTAERVWLELEKTLGEERPWKFFEVLRSCGALKVIFPELEALYGVPQPPQWHPEVDTGIHTMMVLEQACKKSDDKVVRFAALLHDLGKALTLDEYLPSHPGHEEGGVPLVNAMCDRLKVPNEYRKLAIPVCRYHLSVHKASEIRPNTMLKMFEAMGVKRDPTILKNFLDACESDARGRKGLEDREYPQRILFEVGALDMDTVTAKKFIDAGFQGAKIGELMRQDQIMAIKSAVNHKKRELGL